MSETQQAPMSDEEMYPVEFHDFELHAERPEPQIEEPETDPRCNPSGPTSRRFSRSHRVVSVGGVRLRAFWHAASPGFDRRSSLVSYRGIAVIAEMRLSLKKTRRFRGRIMFFALDLTLQYRVHCTVKYTPMHAPACGHLRSSAVTWA